MALTGKAEVIADGAQGLIGVLQEPAAFLQLASENKGRKGEAQFFFKIGGKVGAAKAYIVSHIAGGNVLVGVLLYKANGFLNAVAGSNGGLRFVDLLGKGIGDLGQQCIQIICILEDFRFLNEFIGKLVSRIIIQTAFDGSPGRQGGSDDNIIFDLPQSGRTCDSRVKPGVICF